MESSLWATMGKGIIIQALNHLGLKMQPISFGRISMQHCPNYMFGKIWEDPVGSRCHQFSPVWRTSKRPGPDPVLRATSLRSAPYGVFSARESLPYDFSSPRDDPCNGGMSRRNTFSEHVNFLPSTIHSASHRRAVTNLPNVKKYPTWSFKHDKFRK